MKLVQILNRKAILKGFFFGIHCLLKKISAINLVAVCK